MPRGARGPPDEKSRAKPALPPVVVWCRVLGEWFWDFGVCLRGGGVLSVGNEASETFHHDGLRHGA
jgi:hypothetical protein